MIEHDIKPLCLRNLSQEERDIEIDLEFEELYSNDIEDNIQYLLKRILFIKDSLWGEGYYIVNNCEIICKKVIGIFEKSMGSESCDGIICIKGGIEPKISIGNAMRCIDLLQSLEYCSCLETYGIYEIKCITKIDKDQNKDIDKDKYKDKDKDKYKDKDKNQKILKEKEINKEKNPKVKICVISVDAESG